MRTFTGRLFLYILLFGLITIFEKSPYALDQLYDSSILDWIYQKNYILYLLIAFILVGIVLTKTIYAQFKGHSQPVIRVYFRRYGGRKVLITLLAAILFTYVTSHLLHWTILYINRIHTTSVVTSTYQPFENELDDYLISTELDIKNKGELYQLNSHKFTTKNGLLSIPYQITIDTLQ